MKQYPLYDAQMEHESCGVGAVVDLSGQRSHKTVSDALTIVERLAHRAGCDALGTTGDGVGVLTQLPHALFAAWAAENGWKLGDAGDYGVGMLFVPESLEMGQVKRAMEAGSEEAGAAVLQGHAEAAGLLAGHLLPPGNSGRGRERHHARHRAVLYRTA